MARLSEQEINQIRAKADIVDVVGRYVPLTRKGRNYVAQCPFHDDHDPSMSVNADKQIFKCFVCGTGGNVFGFVQKYEKISFIFDHEILPPLNYLLNNIILQWKHERLEKDDMPA